MHEKGYPNDPALYFLRQPPLVGREPGRYSTSLPPYVLLSQSVLLYYLKNALYDMNQMKLAYFLVRADMAIDSLEYQIQSCFLISTKDRSERSEEMVRENSPSR